MLSALGPALIVAAAPVVTIIALSLAVSAKSSAAVMGFAIGRAAAIAAATLGFAALSAAIAPDPDVLRRVASIVELALALFLIVVALWAWLRPHQDMVEPGWMRRIEGFGWRSGLVLGAVIWLGNPKILVTVMLTGMLLGAQSFATAAGSTVFFVLVGSAPLLALAAARVVAGRSRKDAFERMHRWVLENSWLVLAVVSLLVAVLLIVDAVTGLRA
ncbi:GAP family protein [Microbacterium sp. SLBN-146]|uniref:GAP family protein n=1 Tax=Microbacterium sp. SLBN-146 TaxID=2768457 RepID=UPI001167BDE9|nr:GAP family protein [Microbacterium sp. SLBN-146]TQJ30887.1 Sap-like sulfolipid-1-addressing protein [Microbacterium sp. SLBN-146]